MTDSEKTVRALFCAFNRLAAARSAVDAWDIFPEADFDTGSNLCRTLRVGVESVKRDESLRVCELLDRAATAMLRCAKGTSGLLLAAAFKGFSDEAAKHGGVTESMLPAALRSARDRATLPLVSPVTDGTILGLLSFCAAALETEPAPSLPAAWTALCGAAVRYLRRSSPPDAGALGLTLILEGVGASLNSQDAAPGTVLFQKHDTGDAYTYAASFTVLPKLPFCAPALTRQLRDLGDAVRVEARGDTLAVSLTTNRPDNALTHALRFGALTDISIQNRTREPPL